MSWEPISTAPKDGEIVCWSAKWEDPEPRFLIWKTNDRIVSERKTNPAAVIDMADSYFGDPTVQDDYELSKEGRGPTHWHPLDCVPGGQ